MIQHATRTLVASALSLTLGIAAHAQDPAANQPAPPQPRNRIQPPGPDKFATQPRTPEEFWDAADYLVRSGQPTLAVPYLNAFLAAEPDNGLLVRLRDKYGLGSFLRLQDNDATRELGKQLLDRLTQAARQTAAQPERLSAAIAQLNGSREEQDLGIERLRQAGGRAVPPLLKAISDPGRSADDRAQILSNMGRLDASALPPLIAALDAPDGTLAAAAAETLGRIGDPRAVPALTAIAARPDASPAPREATQRAIQRLTGRPFNAQPRSPVRLLADLAWQYHRGKVRFPSDQVELWNWRDGMVEPESVPSDEAATRLGTEAARAALVIDPADVSAQEALLSLALATAARQHGIAKVIADDPDGTYAAALSAGPALLADVLAAAIADGQSPVAQLAATALGRVTNRDAVGIDPTGRGRAPLVAALDAPDRRVQFAAAKALVDLDPRRPFTGSSRVVPTLARFLDARPLPLALVVDGNASRVGDYVEVLQKLGYDPQSATNGRDAFRLAAEQADYELALIDPTALETRTGWSWIDTITNLRADARTAAIPIIVVGPLALRDKLGSRLLEMDRVGFLVAPSPDSPERFQPLLEQELNRVRARPLSNDERRDYARQAAGLLARVAGHPQSPLASNLDAAGEALSIALTNPETLTHAATALADIPGVEPQRRLADTFLDPSIAADARGQAGAQLVRSIQRFGPLLTGRQEQRLAELAVSETDPALHSAFSAVIGTLKPAPSAAGSRLRDFQPIAAPASNSPQPDTSR